MRTSQEYLQMFPEKTRELTGFVGLDEENLSILLYIEHNGYAGLDDIADFLEEPDIKVMGEMSKLDDSNFIETTYRGDGRMYRLTSSCEELIGTPPITEEEMCTPVEWAEKTNY